MRGDSEMFCLFGDLASSVCVVISLTEVVSVDPLKSASCDFGTRFFSFWACHSCICCFWLSHVSQNSLYCVLAPDWSIALVPSVQGQLPCHLLVHFIGEPSNRLFHLSYIFHFHNFRLVSSQYFQFLLKSYFIFCSTLLISSVCLCSQSETYFLIWTYVCDSVECIV